ncbi:MAG: hypothetical protein LUQ37_08430, partial [Methanoregulaceae archaeon]|nr:hypothetical protein [Methanoregulaceae archaeon]
TKTSAIENGIILQDTKKKIIKKTVIFILARILPLFLIIRLYLWSFLLNRSLSTTDPRTMGCRE